VHVERRNRNRVLSTEYEYIVPDNTISRWRLQKEHPPRCEKNGERPSRRGRAHAEPSVLWDRQVSVDDRPVGVVLDRDRTRVAAIAIHDPAEEARLRGHAIIVGTNFPVSSVAISILRHGMLPEELIRRFPHLSLAQFYDVLSYYGDHQAEIDIEIQRHLDEDTDAAQLPRGEILSLRYDPATDRFAIQSLGKLNADSE
jgi:uncharacterized protein (DUF433 family)